jgi:hypothetical protein
VYSAETRLSPWLTGPLMVSFWARGLPKYLAHEKQRVRDAVHSLVSSIRLFPLLQSAAVSKPPFQNRDGDSARSPCLSRRQSVTAFSKQPGETVLEVDEIEADARRPVLEIATCRPPNLSDRNADLRIMARHGPSRLRSSSHRCG